MKLDIRGLNFDLTDSILEHVRLRLGAALVHVAPHILTVKVRVNDLNGPRGGLDKRCHFEVRLDGHGTVVVEQIDADLYAAIDRAAARLRQTLRRRLERSKEMEPGFRQASSRKESDR